MAEISKVLIANRGEIACRIMKTLTRMSIPGVAVYHAVDANSPLLDLVDESIEIDGVTPVEAYLNIEAIIEACRQTGADAVHPGFGFLAENPVFAEKLNQAGITFIGPPPDVINLMGDKTAARSFCKKHGFPLAPSVAEPDNISELEAQIRLLGFPVLIKASAGGGGKGMHVVRSADQLVETIKLAKQEALRAFGDERIYAERYLENPRHIEVQILADNHGHLVHLGERECSIQRRYQKVIEESPAPNLDPSLRDRICQTAVEIAEKTRYRNAGTIEFMLTPENEFYFLEMNTRIQVEHPVTEWVTGLDIVEWQIRIARGDQLSLSQDDIAFTGHAIELRIYAEDPENDFLPTTGDLLEYRFPDLPELRVDNGFRQGMTVSSAFDPMLAKMSVHADSRKDAISAAKAALEETVILGVVSNCQFLKAVLEHSHFQSGIVHTGFIKTFQDELRPPPLDETDRDLLLAAAILSSRDFQNRCFKMPEPHAFMKNWRN